MPLRANVVAPGAMCRRVRPPEMCSTRSDKAAGIESVAGDNDRGPRREWERGVDQGLVAGDWRPLVDLLNNILERIYEDLVQFDPVCVSVTISSSGGGLSRLAFRGDDAGLSTQGVDEWLLGAQADLGGPIPDAVDTGLPIIVADLWGDARWPRLTKLEMTRRCPELRATWDRIRGKAVLPAAHDQHSMVALSCCLPGPADEHALEVLDRYKQLVESATAVAHAASIDGPEHMLGMLQGRSGIEQAKGAIIAVTGLNAHHAWRILRTASQHNNVKLRDIAMALIEYLGQAPVEQPAGLPVPELDPTAAPAARQLWKQLMTHAEGDQESI